MFLNRRKSNNSRRRLFMEQLETRAVPASFAWTAGVDGDFDVGATGPALTTCTRCQGRATTRI